MRRFLVPPELAPSVALSREEKELESDLERRQLAAVAAEGGGQQSIFGLDVAAP